MEPPPQLPQVTEADTLTSKSCHNWPCINSIVLHFLCLLAWQHCGMRAMLWLLSNVCSPHLSELYKDTICTCLRCDILHTTYNSDKFFWMDTQTNGTECNESRHMQSQFAPINCLLSLTSSQS